MEPVLRRPKCGEEATEVVSLPGGRDEVGSGSAGLPAAGRRGAGGRLWMAAARTGNLAYPPLERGTYLAIQLANVDSGPAWTEPDR